MTLRSAAVMAGLALGAMSGAAQAAIYDFSYTPSVYFVGTRIFAKGQLDILASGFIDSASGTINGSAITGIVGGIGTAYVSGSSASNTENIAFDTASGVSYSFNFPIATASDGSGYGIGDFEISAVPLPSSAPMFGAALAVLGAVGYGLKRTGKAAA